MAKVVWDTPGSDAKPDQTTSAPSNKVIWDQPAQATQQGAQAQAAPPQDDFWSKFWADPNNMKGFGAGLAQGALDPLEGLVQLAAWPVVGRTSQDWLPGLRQAATGKMGAAGEMIGGALPFLFQPELGIGKALGELPRFLTALPKVGEDLTAAQRAAQWIGNSLRNAYNVAQRSTFPAITQPKDPQHMGRDLAEQAVLGTLFGEGLRGVGTVGGKLDDRFTQQERVDLLNARRADAFTKAKRLAEDQQRQTDQSRMVTNEEMRKNYRTMEQEALTKGAASQVARQGALQAQAQIPQDMARRVYQTITGLGRVDMPRDMDLYRAPALTQRAVGQKLDGIYGQMKLDTNDRNITMSLPAMAEEISKKLDGLPVPGIRNEWIDLYDRLVVHRFNQGVITGRELQNYLSTMRNTINVLGLQAQQGKIGARDMANGLRSMLYHIEDVADHFDPNAMKLGEERKQINMAYELASRMVDATDGGRNPIPSPTQFLDAWHQAEGDRHFGLDKRWVEMKTWMQGLEKEHTREIPAPIPPVMPTKPTPFPKATITQPTEPKPLLGPRDAPRPPTPGEEAVGALAGAVAHTHGVYPGAAARMARGAAHGLANVVPQPVARAASKIPPYAPAATAGASNLATPPRPLWIIRGPRGEDLGLANTNDPRYLMGKPPGSHYERTQ